MTMLPVLWWTLSIAFVINVSVISASLKEEHGHKRYLIYVPNTVYIDATVPISVSIFNTTADTDIFIKFTNRTHTFVSVNGTVSPDSTIMLHMVIPMAAQRYLCELHVIGSGGMTINDSLVMNRLYSHSYERKKSNEHSIFIQTDKPLYKPGDIVRFRVFGLDHELKTTRYPTNISLFDKRNNMLQRWINEESTTGVISANFELSDKPVLGKYRIEVKQQREKMVRSFTVREYVLPKYEVTIEANKMVPDFSRGFLFLIDQSINVTVKAKYTFGRAVHGKLVLNATLGRGSKGVRITKVFDHFGGMVKVNIPFIDFRGDEDEWIVVPQYGRSYYFSEVVLMAEVTEKLTGKIMKAEEFSTQVKATPVELQIDNRRQFFKRGLPSAVHINVKRIDGQPLQLEDILYPLEFVMVFLNNEEYSFECQIEQDGQVIGYYTPPKDKEMLHLKIYYKGVYDGLKYKLSRTIYPTEYQALNYTNVEAVAPKSPVPVGQAFNVSFNSTKPISKVLMTIVQNRKIIESTIIDVYDSSEFEITLMATKIMMPFVKVLFSCIATDNTFAVDALEIPVTIVFKNHLTANFSSTIGSAGSKVNLQMNTAPGSTVFVMAVDKSIELLQTPKYITEKYVSEEILGQQYRSYKKQGARNVQNVMRLADLAAITNFLTITEEYIGPIYRQASLGKGRFPNMGIGEADKAPTKPPSVRRYFPETWIWNEEPVGDSGSVTLKKTVPDSITKWVANAFVIHPEMGLGVLNKPAEFTSFQTFFIVLDLPYKVIRGEHFNLKVSVFNYLPTDQEVKVTFLDAGNFKDSGDENVLVKTVQVKANRSELVEFPLVPARVGYIPIKIRAECKDGADEVHKHLLVEPEGVTLFFNKPFLINITDEAVPFTTTFAIPASNGSKVEDSSRVEVSLIGDMMGPAIEGLDNLVRIPHGCGEQNMINFAPNIYIHRYLKASHRLDEDIMKKLIKYTNSGYKNELSYQHDDGSYSAFGKKDKAGSTWLTSFVIKCFGQAAYDMPEVFIDENVIIKGLKWLLVQQNPDGKFDENGRVLHTQMQGGSSQGVAMAAYILISLFENRRFLPDLTESAIKSTEMLLGNEINDTYSQAISLYAMSLLKNEERFSKLEEQLKKSAVVEDDMMYWTHHIEIYGAYPPFNDGSIIPPIPTIKETGSVEMTAYVLLAYAHREDIENGMPVMRWLVSQRSSLGGYHSTQDTVIALEALAKFAALVTGDDELDFTLEVTNDRLYSYIFPAINVGSTTILHKHVMPADTEEIAFVAKGKGWALAQVSWQYNVLEVKQPHTGLNTTLSINCTDHTRMHLRTCHSWDELIKQKKTGMVLIDIQLPSGFEADLDDFKPTSSIKRVEEEHGHVIFYVDELTLVPLCLDVDAHREYNVKGKAFQYPVKTQLYYDTGEVLIVMYEMSGNCANPEVVSVNE